MVAIRIPASLLLRWTLLSDKPRGWSACLCSCGQRASSTPSGHPELPSLPSGELVTSCFLISWCAMSQLVSELGGAGATAGHGAQGRGCKWRSGGWTLASPTRITGFVVNTDAISAVYWLPVCLRVTHPGGGCVIIPGPHS